MNLPLLIAKRTATSATSTQSTMTHIAKAAVAVSIAVMVITVAVVIGFRKEIHATISELSADITITDLATLYGSEVRPITKSTSLNKVLSLTKGIDSIEPYAMRGCVIRSNNDATGIVVKGVTNFNTAGVIAQNITEGQLPRTEDTRYKELLIPTQCAEQLGVTVGSRVELLLMDKGENPRKDLFKVCGIYRAVGDMPTPLVLTEIRNVQRLNGWDYNTYSGFEADVCEGYNIEEVCENLNWNIFEHFDGCENLSAVAASELYAYIVAWLSTHDVNAAVVIAIMFIVALFNMITALLILLFERTRMVGILKSMGMNNREVRKIFLYQAANIVGKGMLWGNVAALAITLIQKYTGVIKMDATAYFVTKVPVEVGVMEILTINTIFAVVILLLLFAVTAIVARIEPAEAVKYE